MPAGQSRGFNLLFKTLQVHGALYYNVSYTGDAAIGLPDQCCDERTRCRHERLTAICYAICLHSGGRRHAWISDQCADGQGDDRRHKE